MYLPNYKNGSIVNLMATLEKEFGGVPQYEPLKDFNPEILAGKNVVLLIIDALGYEFLKKHGRGSFLEKNTKLKITSLLPSTTAVGITAFLTGVSAQQHGLTGWFMYLKELGLVSRILPFTTRAGKIPLTGVKFKTVFNEKSFFKKIKADCYAIQNQEHANSQYSLALTAGAKTLAFNSLEGLFITMKQALKQPGKRKFIYAYWGDYDHLGHNNGCASHEAIKHFEAVDKKIETFAKTLKNTVLIITADHGMIDTAPGKIIKVADHPAFAETLAIPLCGEPRLAYCYVKPDKVGQFKNYVKNNFKNVCEIHKSEELIKKNYFGLFKANLKLRDRVGDYTLIMKDNYIIKDFLDEGANEIKIGNHGGVSEQEMFVPLIVVNK